MAKTTKSPTILATLIVAAALILVACPRGTNAKSPAAAPGPSAPGQFSPAPAPGLDCFPYLLNLSDCLTYVEAGSNLTKPDKGCCPELANLVAVQPICLCELLGNPEQAPVAIDLPRALGLPTVCKVGTPPVSTCAALGIPVGAPVPAAAAGGPSGLSPGGLAPEGTGGLAPEGGLASASPASPKNGSDGQFRASQRHFLVGLAIVLFVSFF